MQQLIYALMDIAYRLPKPMRYLGSVMIGLPLVIALFYATGYGNKWWIGALGLLLAAGLMGIFDGVMSKRGKDKEAQFASDLEKDAQRPGATKQEVREAVRDLAERWTAAIKQLRSQGMSIYEVPWYLLIGEPQSGKSTTLKNSGLEFPLGAEALSGSGGTRSCDWWFANEAVILDTAGRFTFQEENAPDASEWSSFLKLIRRYRKECPINGVLIVIPCTSLLEDSPEEQVKKATNIRQKILHLQRVLEVRFPIFIMVTKADRILGFSEFFSKLNPEDQRQLFGWSTPGGPEKTYDPGVFDTSFDDIINRIHKLRLRFVATEEKSQAVDRIFAFPEELRALGEPLKRYFDTIFQRTRYDEPFIFRGYYISSGVQQGKPIARATRALLGSSAESIMENLEQIFQRSRAFFIKDFYEAKVFPEQGLVSKTKAAAEKDKRNKYLFYSLTAALVLLCLVAIFPAYNSIKEVVNPVREAVRNARDCYEDKQKPCSVARAYDVSQALQVQRARLREKSFWRSLSFALFFGGSKSDLDDIMAKVQQKVYMAKVVTPLIEDTEARMAVLDWSHEQHFKSYKVFFASLDNYLQWYWLKTKKLEAGKPDSSAKPPAEPAKLAVTPLIEFCRVTKGTPATKKSPEVDEWIATGFNSKVADEILKNVLVSGMPADDMWPVASPKRGILKFEEFWSVENLARWDYRLFILLAKYKETYEAMIATADSSDSLDFLARSTATGKLFSAAYDEADKHLKTPKAAEMSFPGINLEMWIKNLEVDYKQLLLYEASVGPNEISERRLGELKDALKVKWESLQSSKNLYVHLVMPDKEKPAMMVWTDSAKAVSGALVNLTKFADIPEFEKADQPQKVLDDALSKSTTQEQNAIIEAFQKKQKDLRDAIPVPAVVPDHQSAFNNPVLIAFVPKAADLSLVYRVLPYAQRFLESPKIIGPGCDATCFSGPGYAKAMADLAVRFISFGEGQSVKGRADVESKLGGIARVTIDYLKRFMDRTSRRPVVYLPPTPGFSVPVRARDAKSWQEFQRIIIAWNPEGGGAPEPPQPAQAAPEPTGGLSLGDVQEISQKNTRFAEIVKYWQDKNKQAAPPKPRAVKPPPQELIQACMTFKANVVPLADADPKKAWKQLSLAQEGVSLRGYHAFTRARVGKYQPWGPVLIEIEKRGANLIRDAIRPGFQQLSDPVWQKLNAEVMGTFPFIRSSELKSKRQDYDAMTLFRKVGQAVGSATWRIELPTINQQHLSGVMSQVTALSDDFALEPILGGREPEFDFVGDPKRRPFNVAYRWERFLSKREHRVEVRALETNPGAGRIFMGDRISQLFFFSQATIFRPSTDVKTNQPSRPYQWRFPAGEAPMQMEGRNESTKGGWAGITEITGGPIRFFYYILVSNQDLREFPELIEDPDRLRDRDLKWLIRVIIPDAEKPNQPLEGLFEVIFTEPMPNVIPG